MPIEIKAWECKFGCGRFYRKRNSVYGHEKRCFHNPTHKACASCNNFHKSREEENELVHWCDFHEKAFIFGREAVPIAPNHIPRKTNCEIWEPQDENYKLWDKD